MIVRQGCSSDHKRIVYASGCQDEKEEKRKQDQPLLQALWLEKIKIKIREDDDVDKSRSGAQTRERDATRCYVSGKIKRVTEDTRGGGGKGEQIKKTLSQDREKSEGVRECLSTSARVALVRPLPLAPSVALCPIVLVQAI